MPELPWRRDTYRYLAMWQGLRGDDLDVDLTIEHTLTCSVSGKRYVVNCRCSKPATSAGTFELRAGDGGTFRFNLKARNHEVILTSQSYTTRAAAISGIDSVRRNAALGAQFERRTARDGSPFFVLLATNGQVIGQSQMYSSTASMEKGIESVRRSAPAAPLREAME